VDLSREAGEAEMFQRIRVNTDNLKKYAEFFRNLAKAFISDGSKGFAETAGRPDLQRPVAGQDGLRPDTA
jgi:hypothetical protein